MTSAEALALLEERGALLGGHFVLSSGRHSQRYLQCAVALQHPEVAQRLGDGVAARVRDEVEDPVEVVVSPALGGLIIGHETGRALGVRACFTERVDGNMTLRRGFRIERGERVLVVEDVVTTGLSAGEAVEAVRAAGGEVVGVACVANRSGGSTFDGLRLVALAALDFPTWTPDECPACADGAEAVKPGSRGV